MLNKNKREKNLYHCFSYLIFLLIFLTYPVSLAGLEGKDSIGLEVIEDAVKKTVAKTGTEAIGQGSWITKKKYKGPLTGGTSDHDMRITLSDELDQEELIKKWGDFQDNLKENIERIGKGKGLSPDEINKLLKNTNVYPPNELMTTVENAEDAKNAFKKYKVTPNLGGNNVEGLFGEGSKRFQQLYEEKAGKLYYKNTETGKVMSGKVDLTHMKEGFAKFTTAGEANNALQWGDKALEELDKGKLDKVQKQVERLKDSLKKGNSLERFGSKTDYLDDIISGKITDPEKIRILIEKAKTEASLLKALSRETSPIKRALVKDLLNEGSGKFSRFRGIFQENIGKIPAGPLMQGLSVYINYADLRDKASQATVTDAELRTEINKIVAKELGLFAGIVPGLIMEITDAVLTSIREGAYGIVTSFQDCEDLVSGIHSVKGRESLEKGMTVERMATYFPDTVLGWYRMRNFIWRQASHASMRFLNNNWVEDPGIREVLHQKCEPQIIKRWQEIRLEKIGEFNRLFKQLEEMINTNMALIAHEPDTDLIPLKEQPKGGQKIARVTVIGRTTKDIGKMEELVKKMNNILSPLEGEKKGDVLFLFGRYEMRIDSGEPITETHKPIRRYLVYSRIGEHNIKLDHELSLLGFIESEDISQHGLLGTSVFSKKIPITATYSFSVVEETRLSAKVKVTVKDKMTGNPIPAANVQVSLLPDGLRMPPSVTDINGAATFGSIPAGQCKIIAKAQGYSQADGKLTIDPAKKQEYSGTVWLQKETAVAIAPSELTGEPNKRYTFTAKVTSPPDKALYEWNFGDGTPVKRTENNTIAHIYSKEGTFNITVRLFDAPTAGMFGEANAKASIKVLAEVKADTEGERARQTKPSTCLDEVQRTVRSGREAYEKWAAVGRERMPWVFACGSWSRFTPCLPSNYEWVWKEVDGKVPKDNWGHSMPAACDAAWKAPGKLYEFHQCVWKEYLAKLEA